MYFLAKNENFKNFEQIFRLNLNKSKTRGPTIIKFGSKNCVIQF